MTRADESGDGHDVVVAIAIPVVEPVGELRHARRDGWIRRTELEPLGAEDGAGLDPATCHWLPAPTADRDTATMRTTKAPPEGPSPTEGPARYI
jgi:hypothetical protein